MTLPSKVLQYCPKCGSNEFNFQGERSFLCNQCGFHFFINSAAAVAGLIENPQGELLLTVRAFNPNIGMLDLPGGFVDPNESAEQALKREIKEELNLDIEHLEYITSASNQYVFSNYTVYTTDIGFYCKTKGWEKLHIMDDISDIVFVDKNNVNYDLIAAESIKKIIKCFWNNKTT